MRANEQAIVRQLMRRYGVISVRSGRWWMNLTATARPANIIARLTLIAMYAVGEGTARSKSLGPNPMTASDAAAPRTSQINRMVAMAAT